MSAAYPAMALSTSIANNTLDKANPNILFVARSFIGVFKAVLTSSQVLLFGFLFAALAGFDDAAFSEKNFLELSLPLWLAAEQEFQIHSKVLEFFLLGSLHDRLGLGVFFQRDTLFVPADGLGLIDQGRAHASEGACFLGQFVWRLVILVETHDYHAP